MCKFIAFFFQKNKIKYSVFLPCNEYEILLQVPSPTLLTIQLMKNEHDKPEESSIYMDPTFAAYLNDELLSVVPERKGKSKIFLKRYELTCPQKK